jgi:hypothetical protein
LAHAISKAAIGAVGKQAFYKTKLVNLRKLVVNFPMKVILLSLLVLLFANGCASGPQFSPADSAPNGNATIYIYRPKQIIGLGGLIPVNSPHLIYLDGTNRVELREGGYCVYYVKPGTNFFSSELIAAWPLNVAFKKDDLFQTNFEATKTYYLRFGVGAVSPKLKMMDSQIGEEEIQSCKLEALKN